MRKTLIALLFAATLPAVALAMPEDGKRHGGEHGAQMLKELDLSKEQRQSIGKLMRDRGLLGPGEANMQGIVAWLKANPQQGTAIMRENKSWVFFRELTGAGPLE